MLKPSLTLRAKKKNWRCNLNCLHLVEALAGTYQGVTVWKEGREDPNAGDSWLGEGWCLLCGQDEQNMRWTTNLLGELKD